MCTAVRVLPTKGVPCRMTVLPPDLSPGLMHATINFILNIFGAGNIPILLIAARYLVRRRAQKFAAVSPEKPPVVCTFAPLAASLSVSTIKYLL